MDFLQIDNFIRAIIESAVVIVVFAIVKSIYDCILNHFLNKKYNLSGEYITRYEDIINGEKKMFTAPAKLKQKGNTIEGETRFPYDKDRDWILKGTISKEKFINGYMKMLISIFMVMGIFS